MTLNRLLVTTALACLAVIGSSCGTQDSGGRFPFSVSKGRAWTYHLSDIGKIYHNDSLTRLGDTVFFENQKYNIDDTVGAADGPFLMRRDSVYLRPGQTNLEFFTVLGEMHWSDSGLILDPTTNDGLFLASSLTDLTLPTETAPFLMFKYPAQPGDTWEYSLLSAEYGLVTIKKKYLGFGEIEAGGLSLEAHHVLLTYPFLEPDTAKSLIRHEYYDSRGLAVVEVISDYSYIDSTGWWYPEHRLIKEFDSLCWRRTNAD